jgi:hypothetical protein
MCIRYTSPPSTLGEPGRLELKPRPPEPHCHSGGWKKRHYVGFPGDSGRRCRTFTTFMSYFAVLYRPQNRPRLPYQVNLPRLALVRRLTPGNHRSGVIGFRGYLNPLRILRQLRY